MKLIDELYEGYIYKFEVSEDAKWHLERFRTALNKALEEDHKCGLCGASIKEYWHRLTPTLVNALIQLKTAVIDKGENKIHISTELGLSKTAYNNFQKLRFHGLVAKFKVKGVWERGYWLITKRGNDFLNGRLAVPKRVLTYRNKVQDHDTKLIYIKDIIGTQPFVDDIASIEYQFRNLNNRR